MKKTVIADAIAVPVLFWACVASYWWLIDDKSPSWVNYQHPRFVSREVHSEDEARRYEITEATPGQVVYRYLDYTLAESRPGLIRRVWMCDGALPIQEPVKSTIGEVGDHKISIAHVIPDIIGREVTCVWKQSIEYRLNAISTATEDYPTITIRVAPPSPISAAR